MCQAAPLGRCSNHSGKDIEKLKEDLAVNRQGQLIHDQKFKDAVMNAKRFGYTDDDIAHSHTDDYLSDVTKHRNLLAYHKREEATMVKELTKQQLHFDATPKGLKALEDLTDGESHARLLAAQSLSNWQAQMKRYKDENGVRLIDKGANPVSRQALYYKLDETAILQGRGATKNLSDVESQLANTRKELALYRRPGIVDPARVAILERRESSAQYKAAYYSQQIVVASTKQELLAKAVAAESKSRRIPSKGNEQKLRDAAKNLSTDNAPFAEKISGILSDQASGIGKTYFKAVNSPTGLGNRGELKNIALGSKARVFEEASSKFDGLRSTKSPDDAIKAMSKFAAKKHQQELLAMASAKNALEMESAKAKVHAYEEIGNVLAGKRKA